MRQRDWNTKNHGTGISTEPLDLVHVNMLNEKIRGSNLKRNESRNSVVLNIGGWGVGGGDNVVHVTVASEAKGSGFADLVSNTAVKIYLRVVKWGMKNHIVVIVWATFCVLRFRTSQGCGWNRSVDIELCLGLDGF